MFHSVEIKEGAIFIADAHYPHHGSEFLKLLRKINNGEIITSQLFLIGDIFDLLFGYNEYILTFYEEALALVKRLSTIIDIYYFEGNHDFCLKDLFSDMYVFSREEQPVTMKLGGKLVSFSHGDKFDAGFVYGVYCKLLRNKITLNFLKPFEKKIIDYQMNRLSSKAICHKISNFEQKVKAIVEHYPNDIDMVIEGHFHQAVKIGKYVSLPSLACQKMYALVKNEEIVFKSFYR